MPNMANRPVSLRSQVIRKAVEVPLMSDRAQPSHLATTLWRALGIAVTVDAIVMFLYLAAVFMLSPGLFELVMWPATFLGSKSFVAALAGWGIVAFFLAVGTIVAQHNRRN